MTRSIPTIVGAATVALSALPALAGGTFNKARDAEPNGTVATASTINLTDGGRVVSFRASLTAGDLDFYKVVVPSANSGRHIVFVTTPISGTGANPFNVVDTKVTIVDQNGVALSGTNDDSGGGTGTQRGSIARYIAPPAGATVYFRVEGFSGTSAGNYVVTVSETFGLDFDFAESGSNNTAANAEVLDLRVAGPLLADANIAPLGDFDFYAVDMRAGEALVACTDPQDTNWFDPDTVIDVLDTDGSTVLANNDDDGCDAIVPNVASHGSLVRFQAPANGRYYVRLSTFASSVTGHYRCFFALIPGSVGTCTGDANGDGQVNFSDILSVLANFNVICP